MYILSASKNIKFDGYERQARNGFEYKMGIVKSKPILKVKVQPLTSQGKYDYITARHQHHLFATNNDYIMRIEDLTMSTEASPMAENRPRRRGSLVYPYRDGNINKSFSRTKFIQILDQYSESLKKVSSPN